MAAYRRVGGLGSVSGPTLSKEYEKTSLFIKSNQIKFISKCKNNAHSKHVMHLGGTARRIALTAAQCYSFTMIKSRIVYCYQHAQRVLNK